jgi:ABC-type glycerol-3-phosphate transport system permease component
VSTRLREQFIAFGGGVFLLRQFYRTTPGEYDEAAMIDVIRATATIMTLLPIAIFALTQRYFKRALVVAALPA